MHKKILIAVTVLAGFAGGGATAAADTLQYDNGGTWTAVPQGGTLTSSLSSGTDFLLESDFLGDTSCSASTLTGRVDVNPGAHVLASVTSMTFGGCSNNSALLELRPCGSGDEGLVAHASPTAPFGVAFGSNPSPDSFALSNIDLDLCIDPVLGTNATCTYEGAVGGSIYGSTLSFTAESIISTTGFPCTSEDWLTAVYVLRYNGSQVRLVS